MASAPFRKLSLKASAAPGSGGPPRPSSSSFKSRIPAGSSSSAATSVRRSSPASLGPSKDQDGVPGRVRVAVRLRPRNAEEMAADADFANLVELQPELKRLKLRKNNWDSDTYEFDEILTEFASQKRVYEVVAKPVVESVLDGYNGTVMAYGQTGTGKTFTLGRLGEEGTADRGIMVRAMEDILASVSFDTDSVAVSYLQLYMETIQDLLDPANDNIPIVEDPKTGDVSLPGATIVDIRDHQTFMELLRLGEAHRIAANTKLNTESSRSHAILMVHIKRSVDGCEDTLSVENGRLSHLIKPSQTLIRKSKLVVVDLAGSERIHKSGSRRENKIFAISCKVKIVYAYVVPPPNLTSQSVLRNGDIDVNADSSEGQMLEEAKSINLSLSALGKCINALAENSSHVPVRDSKLTRLLRDSFGGTARTSLIITIGPSPRHRGETTSTILFGQRAMKVENMLKIKEEFDYKSLSRKLEIQVDKLIVENEKLQKECDDEVERVNMEAQNRITEVERTFAEALEKERMKLQMEYMESIKELEEKLVCNQQKHNRNGFMGDKRPQEGHDASSAELSKRLNDETSKRKAAEEEVNKLQNQLALFTLPEGNGNMDMMKIHKKLEDEADQRKKLEEEVVLLRSQLLQVALDTDQARRYPERGGFGDMHSRNFPFRENANGQKASIATLSEQVGLQKILTLLESDDANVRIHAVKVIANLAAEEVNQERIVEAGGLLSLLTLLRRFEDETVRRVAAGAIANLAMNEANQELIMAQGGISLLSVTASSAEDPQTLRMVAGAIANLCGNDKLQSKLRTEGGIRALLGTVRCGHPDVLSQVARGIANFAKCESRLATQGLRTGKSLLIEDGALPWIVHNANDEAAPIRRHIELALCHLAQHEVNAKDMVIGGALWELVRISRDCTREDIRNLARKTLVSSPTFRAELRRLRVDY